MSTHLYRNSSRAALVPEEGRFRMLRLPPERLAALARNSGTFDEHCGAAFEGDGLLDRFARALGRRRAVRAKEFLEACEFFACVRRKVRAPVVADLCAGHGLVGALYALFERDVERVLLVDRRTPPSRANVLDAAAEAGSWAAAKLEPCDGPLEQRGHELPLGAALVAVHACGELTDRCLELALRLGGPIGLMPCCRPHRRSPAPRVLARELGDDLAFDIDRTYRLEAGGLTVRWGAIAASITPMNRVLLAWSRRPPGGPPAAPEAAPEAAPRAT